MQTTKIITSAAALLAAATVSGCGGGSSAPAAMTPPPSQIQVLDTAAVLAIAHAPSDADDPLPVGPKGTSVADPDDETSDPVPVTA